MLVLEARSAYIEALVDNLFYNCVRLSASGWGCKKERRRDCVKAEGKGLKLNFPILSNTSIQEMRICWFSVSFVRVLLLFFVFCSLVAVVVVVVVYVYHLFRYFLP